MASGGYEALEKLKKELNISRPSPLYYGHMNEVHGGIRLGVGRFILDS
jgi:hypothetical protein